MPLPRVLVVEDNPIDAAMIKRALKLGGLIQDPVVVNDGAPAIALLKREAEYANSPRPDLIVLDLNLITVDGGEVLNFVRRTPDLKAISVAILSSTPTDVCRANYAEADCYFTKPSDLLTFERIGREILDCYSDLHRKTM